MDPEQAWQDLAAAALLGTERRAFAPPSAAGPLGAVLGGLEGRGSEKALLGAAAALALFRRAGRLPCPDPSPMMEPAGVDDRPRCSVGSDGHLALMLSGTHAEALPEWLAAATSAGKLPRAEEAGPRPARGGTAPDPTAPWSLPRSARSVPGSADRTPNGPMPPAPGPTSRGPGTTRRSRPSGRPGRSSSGPSCSDGSGSPTRRRAGCWSPRPGRPTASRPAPGSSGRSRSG